MHTSVALSPGVQQRSLCPHWICDVQSRSRTLMRCTELKQLVLKTPLHRQQQTTSDIALTRFPEDQREFKRVYRTFPVELSNIWSASWGFLEEEGQCLYPARLFSHYSLCGDIDTRLRGDFYCSRTLTCFVWGTRDKSVCIIAFVLLYHCVSCVCVS